MRRQGSWTITLDLKLPKKSEIAWFQSRLLKWWERHRREFPWRKRSASNYTKIVSEVLLQRTRAEVVARFLPSFLAEFPSWRALAGANSYELQAHLRPLGLWRRRSASLKSLAVEMAKRRGLFPLTREEIEELPNVGQYIANAVLLFCHKQPQPLLDVNMARVLERFFGPRQLADIRYDPYLQILATAVITNSNPVEMNWAILDHASLICRIGVPLCNQCPLVLKCKFARGVIDGNHRKS
jgi:A/G-specific adenine glycosylase